jgi:hypothetical protein
MTRDRRRRTCGCLTEEPSVELAKTSRPSRSPLAREDSDGRQRILPSCLATCQFVGVQCEELTSRVKARTVPRARSSDGAIHPENGSHLGRRPVTPLAPEVRGQRRTRRPRRREGGDHLEQTGTSGLYSVFEQRGVPANLPTEQWVPANLPTRRAERDVGESSPLLSVARAGPETSNVEANGALDERIAAALGDVVRRAPGRELGAPSVIDAEVLVDDREPGQRVNVEIGSS